jgi:hypothetical protein
MKQAYTRIGDLATSCVAMKLAFSVTIRHSGFTRNEERRIVKMLRLLALPPHQKRSPVLSKSLPSKVDMESISMNPAPRNTKQRTPA